MTKPSTSPSRSAPSSISTIAGSMPAACTRFPTRRTGRAESEWRRRATHEVEARPPLLSEREAQLQIDLAIESAGCAAVRQYHEPAEASVLAEVRGPKISVGRGEIRVVPRVERGGTEHQAVFPAGVWSENAGRRAAAVSAATHAGGSAVGVHAGVALGAERPSPRQAERVVHCRWTARGIAPNHGCSGSRVEIEAAKAGGIFQIRRLAGGCGGAGNQRRARGGISRVVGIESGGDVVGLAAIRHQERADAELPRQGNINTAGGPGGRGRIPRRRR